MVFIEKRIQWKTWCLIAFIMSILSGCNSIPKRPRVAPPEHLVEQASIPHVPKARFWGDETPPFVNQLLAMSNKEVAQAYPNLIHRKIEVLAVSGGGANGAFTTGLMTGWTARGDRPDFMIVTGISTGAIIAPFIFLGPEYDPVLLELYTKYATKETLIKRNRVYAIARDALYDTAPLRQIMMNYLTDDVVEKIAQEHRKGRRLLLGSVNIDIMRPVTWDLGQIAISTHPGKRELIVDVIMASSAIPCVFPPVFIDVEANGATYQEMHVDGGIHSQIMTGSISYHRDDVVKKLKAKGTPRLYVIRNAKVEPKWEAIEPKITDIAARSLSSLIRTQGLNNLKQLYLTAKRDGFDIYMTAIPKGFDHESEELFDLKYMNALVDEGYEAITTGDPWIKKLD